MRFDPETDEFVLTTHSEWEQGEEVFINYGGFTPQEFLTGYGFVPREADLDGTKTATMIECVRAFEPESAAASNSGEAESEIAALERLAKELRTREGKYLSTLEQDEAAQKQHGSSGGMTDLEHAASLIALLVREKRLLRACGETVAEALTRAQLRKIGIT